VQHQATKSKQIIPNKNGSNDNSSRRFKTSSVRVVPDRNLRCDPILLAKETKLFGPSYSAL
jgi:hypothetical protein